MKITELRIKAAVLAQLEARRRIMADCYGQGKKRWDIEPALLHRQVRDYVEQHPELIDQALVRLG